MRAFYLFEFCDQEWVPNSVRECLFECMDSCNSGLRSFNRKVANTVIEMARNVGLKKIIELGAGRAPITTCLAEDDRSEGLTLIPCDITPNQAVYRQLAAKYEDRVQPIFSSVDITDTHEQLDSAVLVLAGMMHHIPFELRPAVLEALSQSSSKIAMFEPLKRSLLSIFLATLAVFPALLLPVVRLHRPGRLRRFLWCWLLPVVPPMFACDGVVSCLRQWTEGEWQAEFDRLGDLARAVEIHSQSNSLQVIWSGKEIAITHAPPTVPTS